MRIMNTWKNLQIIGTKNHGQIVEGFTIAKGLQQFLSKNKESTITKTLSYNRRKYTFKGKT